MFCATIYYVVVYGGSGSGAGEGGRGACVVSDDGNGASRERTEEAERETLCFLFKREIE
jgi:hypothetical protein